MEHGWITVRGARARRGGVFASRHVHVAGRAPSHRFLIVHNFKLTATIYIVDASLPALVFCILSKVVYLRKYGHFFRFFFCTSRNTDPHDREVNDPRGTTMMSVHCVPVQLVLGDAPAAPQPHPGHALRPRRLVEGCVGLPPRLPTALRRRLPGGQLAGIARRSRERKTRPRARQPRLAGYTARRCWASYSTYARAYGLTD